MNLIHGLLKAVLLMSVPILTTAQITGVHYAGQYHDEQPIKGSFDGVAVNVYPQALEFIPGAGKDNRQCWQALCDGPDQNFNGTLRQHGLSKVRMTPHYLEIIADPPTPENAHKNNITVHYSEIHPTPVFQTQPTGITVIDQSAMLALVNSTTITWLHTVISEVARASPAFHSELSSTLLSSVYQDYEGNWHTREPVPTPGFQFAVRSDPELTGKETVSLDFGSEYLSIYPLPAKTKVTLESSGSPVRPGSYTFSHQPRQVPTGTETAATTQERTQESASQTETATSATAFSQTPAPTGTAVATTGAEASATGGDKKKEDDPHWNEKVYGALTDYLKATELNALLNEESASGTYRGKSYLSIAIEHNNVLAVQILLNLNTDLIGKPMEELETRDRPPPPFFQFFDVYWGTEEYMLRDVASLIYYQLLSRDEDWLDYTQFYMREFKELRSSHSDALRKLIRFYHDHDPQPHQSDVVAFNPSVVPSEPVTVADTSLPPPPGRSERKTPDTQFQVRTPEFYIGFLGTRLETLAISQRIAIRQSVQSLLARRSQYFRSQLLKKVPDEEAITQHPGPGWQLTEPVVENTHRISASPANSAADVQESVRNPWWELLNQNRRRVAELHQRKEDLILQLPGDSPLNYLDTNDPYCFNHRDIEFMKKLLAQLVSFERRIEQDCEQLRQNALRAHVEQHRLAEKSQMAENLFQQSASEYRRKLQYTRNTHQNLVAVRSSRKKVILWFVEQSLDSQFSLTKEQRESLLRYLESLSALNPGNAADDDDTTGHLSGEASPEDSTDFVENLTQYLQKLSCSAATVSFQKPESGSHHPWESLLPEVPEDFPYEFLEALWQEQAELETDITMLVRSSGQDALNDDQQATSKSSDFQFAESYDRLNKLLEKHRSNIDKCKEKMIRLQSVTLRYNSEKSLAEVRAMRMQAERDSILMDLQKDISRQEAELADQRKRLSEQDVSSGEMNLFAQYLVEGLYFIVKELGLEQ